MDSEREEGEIVDELDDLSDISSEEETLLRERLEILENYNKVLERKEAKRCSIGSGPSNENKDSLTIRSLSYGKNEISPNLQIYRVIKNDRHIKKQKRPNIYDKEDSSKIIKNKHRGPKTPPRLTNLSDSSEDSNDEEYKKKRQKLENAVSFSTNKKFDSSSLKDRIAKMLQPKLESINTTQQIIKSNTSIILKSDLIKSTTPPLINKCIVKVNDDTKSTDMNCLPTVNGVIETVSDKITEHLVEETNKNDIHESDRMDASDEDIESLRQHALDTKYSKKNYVFSEGQNAHHFNNKRNAEDEDSDTEELRIICLRSTILKKAIEIKKKQKLKKRLSQTSIICQDMVDKFENNGNSTDVENVDMDIGSDVDEKYKEHIGNPISNDSKINNNNQYKEQIKELKANKIEEFEEDEDLLRAKLLTSLSKNLPILAAIHNNTSNNTVDSMKDKTTIHKKVEEKKFIIELGDSDSETEHEATRSLTKMHRKLADDTEFQLKLDQFLKSTRMQVEQGVQQPVPVKTPNKFIPKAMNHLPKSEQIEYKKLVKRMRELEKLKETRQLMLNKSNKSNEKDMLKPRNIPTNEKEAMEKKLEEKIAKSRKNIAEESAKMLKLKEEGKKLSQRYKIVSNELRNITTAITLNKKQQRNVQNGLNKIRLQHQMLLKSSPITRSTLYTTLNTQNLIPNNRKQKENDPSIKNQKNANVVKTVKVSSVNDFNKEDTKVYNPQLSIEVSVSNNSKVIKIPKTVERTVNLNETPARECNERDLLKEQLINDHKITEDAKNINDYISPLDAMGRTKSINLSKNAMIKPVDGICVRTSQCDGAAIWQADPNAFLCPYEVGGTCRDTDCKFLHLQTQ